MAKCDSKRGEAMPVGWMIDREGKPLTDPKRADEGYLRPIGDYKGYALSLIIALLAGAINRAAVGREVIDFVKETGKATNTGQAIRGLSIEAFMPPAEFKKCWMPLSTISVTQSDCPGSSASGFPASKATPSASTAVRMAFQCRKHCARVSIRSRESLRLRRWFDA